MKYCRVIKVFTKRDSIGDEKYVLCLECGEQVTRLRRKLRSSKIYPCPKKVKCDCREIDSK